MSRRMSQSDLSNMITEQHEKTLELSRQAGVSVRSLTDEEREAIRNHEISRSELIDRLVNEEPSTPVVSESASSDSDSPAPAQDPVVAEQQTDSDSPAQAQDPVVTEQQTEPGKYTVKMAEGAGEGWTITPAEATTTGVDKDTKITATYSGTKHVKSVKAVKK